MSHNAEPKSKVNAENSALWESAPDWEHIAINKALTAYQDSPGDSTRVAMLRACRKYASIVNAAVGTIRSPK